MLPKHILVFRFSALGDVAMTVPVVKLVLQQYPHLHITFVSTGFVQPLFNGIERLQFVAADTKSKHKGIAGLYRLYKELTTQHQFDAVADLHNVLRTQILRVFFSSLGKPIAVIDKGRKEKRKLTRRYNKELVPLRTTFQRYADVFAKLNLPVVLNTDQGIIKLPHKDAQWTGWKQNNYKLIGIAPFAQYSEKTYPLEKMKQVIQLLLQQNNVKIFLFGGKADAPLLQQITESYKDNIYSFAAKMSFAEELSYIAQLHVMISMDSANMHLASLYGVPVVSIWGGTHPYLGFYGWGQPLDNAVQIDLDCRPSSVFGKKPCPNQLACLQGITPVFVYNKIMQVLEQTSEH